MKPAGRGAEERLGLLKLERGGKPELEEEEEGEEVGGSEARDRGELSTRR